MPEESKEEQTTATVEDNYLEQIKNLKENTVSKEEYEKVMEDNRKLLDSFINGTKEEKEEPEEEVDIVALRDELFNQENSNLEYCEKALKLRNALMKQGEPDPFLPSGHKIIATDADIAAADKVAKVMEHCIEFAEGDSELFTNELMRLTNDVSPMLKRR